MSEIEILPNFADNVFRFAQSCPFGGSEVMNCENLLCDFHNVYLSFFCILIITRLRWFVKTLFEFFQKDFFNLYCTLTSLRTRQGFVASFISHLGCVPLLYHNLGDLSRGFLHFLRIFFRKHLRLCYAHNGKHSSTATLSP